MTRGSSDRGTDASHVLDRMEAERITLRWQFENLHRLLNEGELSPPSHDSTAYSRRFGRSVNARSVRV